MTYLDFSRPAKDWDGDTFEEENENMAALAMQSVAGDDEDEEEDEEDEEEKAAAAAIPNEEGVAVEPVAEEEEEEEEEGVNELKDLERLERAVKEDDLEGIGSLLGEEDEAM